MDTILSELLFYQNPTDKIQTQEGSTQVNGTPTEINSCRGCNLNLASDNPASQYQRQKIIQNTVRVASSLYTMNLAGLSGYQKPLNTYQLIEQSGSTYLAPPRVYWNQMSDRARASKQIANVSSNFKSSTKHTITRLRPGAMSPGGIGVDIKHNSYNRYLNKLKGKAPLRRGIIPPNYGAPIDFNRAFPIYGGKIVKTSIINNCNCPDIGDNLQGDKRIYGPESNAIQDNIFAVKYIYNIGDFVWAKKTITDSYYYKAQIINIENNLYYIHFVDDDINKTVLESQLLIYFNCDCSVTGSNLDNLSSGNINSEKIEQYVKELSFFNCDLLNKLTQTTIL